METLATWQAILMKDLCALIECDERDAVGRIRYMLKEQAVGQHCCQAGEDLTDEELLLLRKALGLTAQQWQTYKSKMCSFPEA